VVCRRVSVVSKGIEIIRKVLAGLSRRGKCCEKVRGKGDTGVVLKKGKGGKFGGMPVESGGGEEGDRDGHRSLPDVLGK